MWEDTEEKLKRARNTLKFRANAEAQTQDVRVLQGEIWYPSHLSFIPVCLLLLFLVKVGRNELIKL